jgi:hypothetical protein
MLRGRSSHAWWHLAYIKDYGISTWPALLVRGWVRLAINILFLRTNVSIVFIWRGRSCSQSFVRFCWFVIEKGLAWYNYRIWFKRWLGLVVSALSRGLSNISKFWCCRWGLFGSHCRLLLHLLRLSRLRARVRSGGCCCCNKLQHAIIHAVKLVVQIHTLIPEYSKNLNSLTQWKLPVAESETFLTQSVWNWTMRWAKVVNQHITHDSDMDEVAKWIRDWTSRTDMMTSQHVSSSQQYLTMLVLLGKNN